jgi:hypothetical protein
MKNKGTLLWLDDVRNPFENHWVVTFSPILNEDLKHIEWVKSYNEFINWIKNNELPEAICFDHDLGMDVSLDARSKGMTKKKSRLLKQKEKTGFDCAKWLVDYCLDNNKSLPLYNIQSANPVGKANIDSLLLNYSRTKDSWDSET